MSMVLPVKSWVRSTISTEEKEGEANSTEEVKEEAISMTGRFSSMQVELQEAADRKSQYDF